MYIVLLLFNTISNKLFTLFSLLLLLLLFSFIIILIFIIIIIIGKWIIIIVIIITGKWTFVDFSVPWDKNVMAKALFHLSQKLTRKLAARTFIQSQYLKALAASWLLR